jgi:hypothetical protein
MGIDCKCVRLACKSATNKKLWVKKRQIKALAVKDLLTRIAYKYAAQPWQDHQAQK